MPKLSFGGKHQPVEQNVTEQIKVLKFDPPSGKVKGLVNAFATIKGKETRVAHATLMVDGDPDIAITVPRKLNATEVGAVAETLAAFVNKLPELA
jgi:hypothetical protein